MTKVHAYTGPSGSITGGGNQGGIVLNALDTTDVPPTTTVKVAANGTAGTSRGSGPTITGIVKNAAGDYTVTLAAAGPVAADLGARLTCNTTLLNGSAVITDATHIAVATRTDAGVATDSIFTLDVIDLSAQ